MVLRWFKDATDLRMLARDGGVSVATAYRYVHEGIDVIAAHRPARGTRSGPGAAVGLRVPGRHPDRLDPALRPDDDEGRRAERAREIALFRYALIRPAADPGLSTRQRGPLVRELAAAEHLGPFGDRVQISRVTLDRWIRAWRAGGFDALVPSTRHVEPRTAAALLELAECASLKWPHLEG